MLGKIVIKGKLQYGKRIIYEEFCVILLMHKVVPVVNQVMDVFEQTQYE
jgi:hypothetical protein